MRRGSMARGRSAVDTRRAGGASILVAAAHRIRRWRRRARSCDALRPADLRASSIVSDPSPFDPFSLWRDLLSQWEKGANRLATEAAATDAFSEGMHKSLGTSLAAKKMSTDVANRYLAALNVPNREDIAALGERLQAIEERLIALAETVEHLADGRGDATTRALSVAGPRRTRKPPAVEGEATASGSAAPARTAAVESKANALGSTSARSTAAVERKANALGSTSARSKSAKRKVRS